MMRPIAAAVLLTVGAAVPAAAQHVCANRDVLLESLADEFKEHPKAVGVTANGNVVEVLTAQDGRTWTILLTQPDGTSCVVASGEDWELLPQVAQGPDA